MLVNRIKAALEQAYWAGVDLCPTGTSLDYGSMEEKIDRLLFEFEKDVRNLIDRNTALKFVVEDLLEQHERQIDMEDCGRRCSYPDRFPEWDRAWDNAQELICKCNQLIKEAEPNVDLVTLETMELLERLADSAHVLASKYSFAERGLSALQREDASLAHALAAQIREILHG